MMWSERAEIQEELDRVLQMKFIPWESLRNRTIFLTGATGLIGKTLIAVLLRDKEAHPNGLRILALVRDVDRAKKLLGAEAAQSITFLQGDVETLPEVMEPVDYVIHCACPTGSAFFVEKPVETIHSIVAGTRRVLELARKKNVRGMVYLSSMEVYGQVLTGEPLPEETLGQIDLMSVRSSYSEGKRMAECLCHAYAEEYGVPVRIARLAQTFGPGVDSQDGRVFAYLARCALAGENIVLKTDGSKENAYLYTMDAVSAILGLLEKGTPGTPYNVVNEDTYCSVKQMAEMVARTVGRGTISVQTNMDKNCTMYPPPSYLNLDATKLHKLGWRAETGLTEMYRYMIASFETREEERHP